ncbi:MAG TPA: peptidoglycan editing factor PgeF [Terriglobales bacterium]|jgi:purine-nucleoside/S-methyl-5'-thioadenosine phosphorylase / adenosine deaminase|nr:peptidoglycan editing factor PgeF [Terriglobales bacterium]
MGARTRTVGTRTANTKINILNSEILNFPWLVHGFSTRVGGHSTAYGGSSLNLGFTKHDTRAAVEQNREAFLRALNAGRGACRLVTQRQVHSDLIHYVTAADAHPTGDGLITDVPGLLLGVQTADCLPVLLVDTKRRAAGAFHAGWRGTLQRIVEKGVGEMRRQFGSAPADLRAAIGPGIHSCCYQVGEEVREKFHSQFAYAGEVFREVRESNPLHEKYPLLFLHARPPGHGPEETLLYLDLVAANTRQLLDAGVLSQSISTSPLCTSCRTDLLFSYRKEKGVVGRLLGVVGIRS